MTDHRDLILIFTEHTGDGPGRTLGEVRLIKGVVVGPPALVSTVRHRMQRDGCGPAEALSSLDGWSNGYLSTRLD